MATQTITLPSFNNDQVAFFLDYDDVSGHPLTLRCVNGSNLPAACDITDASGAVLRALTFPANVTTNTAVPNNIANQIVIGPHNVVDGTGKFDGWHAFYRWPA